MEKKTDTAKSIETPQIIVNNITTLLQAVDDNHSFEKSPVKIIFFFSAPWFDFNLIPLGKSSLIFLNSFKIKSGDAGLVHASTSTFIFKWLKA